jgi:hypothetical protein
MPTKKPFRLWPYRTLSEHLSRAVQMAMFADGPDAIARVASELSLIFPNAAPPLPRDTEQANLEKIQRIIALAPGENRVDWAHRITRDELSELKVAMLSVYAFVEQDFGRDSAHVPYS